jgi:ABC-type glycerol-3-phosphate transport system substrate-binding protein
MKLPRTTTKTRNLLAASALLLAGFGGGAVLAATGSADAATGSPATSSTDTHGHSGETALTGTTAAKVKAAALAKYPGATVERVETDSDGVYEAHVTTKAGDDVTVQVDGSFTVTGTETGGGGHGHDQDDASSSSTAG